MANVDDYIRQVIQQGDEGSKLLAALCAPTLKNSRYVHVLEEGMNGLTVLRIPEEYNVVVHSATGNPKKTDVAKHAASMVDRLAMQAAKMGITPIGFANVIDSSDGSTEMLKDVSGAMVDAANRYGVAIMNGENAILGSRITQTANVSGTMVSLLPKSSPYPTQMFEINGVRCGIFDPQGKAVFLNSDGVGTKTEFYERAGNYPPALRDSLAMKVDDAAKIGAQVKVIGDVVETKGNIPISAIEALASRIGQSLGIQYVLEFEDVGDRLRGWNPTAPTFNISGSAVSVIDEERLKHPLLPQEGDYLIAIRGKPNPRSNGITAKRKTMIQLFGENWHETAEGKDFLDYLAEPSVVFYPVFNELIQRRLVSGVYHMSGGSHNGKLARPLSRHGLFASLDDLFLPDPRERRLSEASSSSVAVMYEKSPMGNDGYVATNNPAQAIAVIESHGLEARQVGRLERARDGRKGIELKAYTGETVYFGGN